MPRHTTVNVLLSLTVEQGGKPSNIKVARSSGFPTLDQDAVDALERYKFAPALFQGKPVDVEIRLTISVTQG